MSMSLLPPAITPERFDAVLFDMDGVLTDTTGVHATCWKETFDAFLQQRAARTQESFRSFDIDMDYKRYLDGKPRLEGIASFLAARGIQLPYGDPQAPANTATIHGLGKRKNELVKAVFNTQGVEAYDDAVRLVRDVRRQGIKTAVVSSSTNCAAVLRAAGIAELFELRLDGVVTARLQLAGKPAPDTYLKAAVELGATPERSVVVEDAIAGVQAGRAGGFGLVIGIDRKGDAALLAKHGADLVVSGLGQIAR